MQDLRFVVIHLPGAAWQPGVPMFEQEGLQAHIEHYRQWLAGGQLALGGPFLDGGGSVGMMIPEPGLTEDEVTAFASVDPCVMSGLLRFEVRRWMVGMKRAG